MDLVFDSDPAEIGPGEITTLTCHPGRRCRGVQLRMLPDVADAFFIEDIRVGFFSELTTARDVFTGAWFRDGDEDCLALVLSVCEAHEDFALIVRNVDLRRRPYRFRATIQARPTECDVTSEKH